MRSSGQSRLMVLASLSGAALMSGWLLSTSVHGGALAAALAAELLVCLSCLLVPVCCQRRPLRRLRPVSVFISSALSTACGLSAVVAYWVALEHASLQDMLAQHALVSPFIAIWGVSISLSLGLFLVQHTYVTQHAEIARLWQDWLKKMNLMPQPKLVLVDEFGDKGDKEGGTTDCPICLEGLDNLDANRCCAPPPQAGCWAGRADLTGKGILVLPCKHRFHGHCMQQWMERDMTCPCCRKQFRSISSCRCLCLRTPPETSEPLNGAESNLSFRVAKPQPPSPAFVADAAPPPPVVPPLDVQAAAGHAVVPPPPLRHSGAFEPFVPMASPRRVERLDQLAPDASVATSPRRSELSTLSPRGGGMISPRLAERLSQLTVPPLELDNTRPETAWPTTSTPWQPWPSPRQTPRGASPRQTPRQTPRASPREMPRQPSHASSAAYPSPRHPNWDASSPFWQGPVAGYDGRFGPQPGARPTMRSPRQSNSGWPSRENTTATTMWSPRQTNAPWSPRETAATFSPRQTTGPCTPRMAAAQCSPRQPSTAGRQPRQTAAQELRETPPVAASHGKLLAARSCSPLGMHPQVIKPPPICSAARSPPTKGIPLPWAVSSANFGGDHCLSDDPPQERGARLVPAMLFCEP